MPPAPTTTRDLPGGAGLSMVLRRHQRLRVEALGDDAVLSVLAFAAERPAERLNVPDTLKSQMQARLRPPMALVSHLGRALLSMTGSSLDWHDALTAHSTEADLARYGPSSYAADRNAWRRSARTLLLDELAKHDLDERDLHANANLFVKVVPTGDAAGTLQHVPGHARTGDWVELRAELDVLLVMVSCPHPLDAGPTWAPASIRLQVEDGPPPGPDDATRLFRAESARALDAAR